MTRAAIISFCAFLLSAAANGQQRVPGSDSLMHEMNKTASVVDSLRKKADDQDRVIASLKKMIQVLSHSSDTATNGLAGWRNAYTLQMTRFDSTLVRLDSSLKVLARLKQMAGSVPESKNQKNFRRN